MANFVEITDLTVDDLGYVLDRADALQEHWREGTMPRSLAGNRLGLWFPGSGFRNRIAFEIGARAMGADVSFVPGELGIHEPLDDIGPHLGNWFSMLAIRAARHADLLLVAEDAGVPVINARTDYNHPCEIVGDLHFIRRRRGSLEGLQVVFVGEVTNLCRSWLEAARRFPIGLVQVAPAGYLLAEDELASLNDGAAGTVSTTADLHAAVTRETEVIYTDCWPNAGNRELVARTFLPYQITTEVVARMAEHGFFLPCPPVTRGEEVSAASLATEQCRVYEAKEHLLHAQNAIMEFVALGR